MTSTDAGAALVNIIRTAPAARAVAYRQTSRAPGAGSSKPGSRMPLDLTAAAGLNVALDHMIRWVGQPSGAGDPLVELATLTQRMVIYPAVAAWVADVLACERIVVDIASGPQSRRYLGTCAVCAADLYALPGVETVVCHPCGMEYARDDLVERLARIVRSKRLRASLIASAYGISVGTIRSWASRGKLGALEWDEQGRPLFLVADVLALKGGLPS